MSVCYGKASVGPTLARFNAKLLLQIHDELLFEVPQEQVQSFVDAAVPELTQVVPEFAVPVILEAKEERKNNLSNYFPGRIV